MSVKSLVLIPGAWHSANCYESIIPLLKNQGFSPKALNLPSVTGHSANAFNEDVQHIKAEVTALVDAGEDVALVVHSYGAVPVCEALNGLSKSHRTEKGLPGGVVALVFLCAWVLPVGDGNSIWEIANLPVLLEAQAGVKEENGRLHILAPEAFYHDLSAPEITKWGERLGTQDAESFKAIISYPAYRDIPSAYLSTRNDLILPYEIQRRLIESADFKKVDTWDSGHSPFLSQPEETVGFIVGSLGDLI